LGLQRVLGLGSYKTACAILHKLRRAMVGPGRDRLDGVVAVDEAYWGGEETGAIGRRTELKALVIVAAQEDGKGIGRIRLRSIPDVTKASLHGFIAQAIAPVIIQTGRDLPSIPDQPERASKNLQGCGMARSWLGLNRDWSAGLCLSFVQGWRAAEVKARLARRQDEDNLTRPDGAQLFGRYVFDGAGIGL
jgi:ISXO2-like transposase domain